MLKLSKKHKDQIIGGLIAAFLLLITLTIKHFFFNHVDIKETHNDISQHIIQSPTISAISKDSSKQTVTQVAQVNSNKGNVNNDFVSGDKKTYNTYTQSKNRKKDTDIINNGFLNQGGTSNTYNQTLNPDIPQRHFTKQDFEKIKSMLPEKTKNIAGNIYNFDQESMALGNEMLDFFELHGYTIAMKPLGEILSTVPKDKFGKVELGLSSDSTMCQFYIFPLK
jgi:hypothetical protein